MKSLMRFLCHWQVSSNKRHKIRLRLGRSNHTFQGTRYHSAKLAGVRLRAPELHVRMLGCRFLLASVTHSQARHLSLRSRPRGFGMSRRFGFESGLSIAAVGCAVSSAHAPSRGSNTLSPNPLSAGATPRSVSGPGFGSGSVIPGLQIRVRIK
jgi:hypothetical protein